MLRRVGSFVAMILVATFVLAACGSQSEEIKPTVTRTDAENAPPPPTATVEGGAPETTVAPEAPTKAAGGGEPAGPVTIDVVMVDIAFETKEYTVPANTEVTVNVVNNGAASHNFTIDALGVASGDMAAGESKTLTFNSGEAGEYEFYCSIPGHKEAGMVGKLIVEAASADAPTETTAAPDAPAAQTTFDVEMKDIAFSVKELTLPANTEITINLTNSGAATHNFDIPDLGVASGDYASGQTGTVTFNSGPAGEHEFLCNIPGHKEAGMVGKVIVVEGGGAAAPAEATPPVAATAETTAAPDAAAAQTTFDVEMKDIAFNVKELVVPANTEITINLTNTGAATHNFDIPDLGVASGDYAAGQTGTLTFNSGPVGEHEFLCNIPGHKEVGMVGKVIVVEGGGEAAPAESTPAVVATTEPAVASDAPAAQTTFDVEMKDIAFNVKELVVPANTEITINLTNTGAATHNFDIPDLGVASGDYAAGQTGTLTFNSGPVGEHEFLCNIPGHKEVGMVGKVIVVEGGGATAPAEATPANATAAASPAASPVAAPVTTMDVELLDIKFAVTGYTVPANTEITVNLTNNGAATHNFNIDALGVASGDIAAGESKTITFNSGAPGEYEFYCAIPGHKEVGMVGKLTVVDAVAAESPVAETAGTTTFEVEMKDISFAEKELTVPANSEITINLTNTGAASHNFNIDDLAVVSGDYVAGQTGTITFKTGAPGEYEYYCNIPGHKEAGMVGKLIVK